ncbi:tyrosine kinase receptor Cad96Ca [Trichonephila inaurata madagascariensis]|uniref:Tyrosine kinase receptor Cad96Ca n=1 Tax=Trichonephila inaurata madagascariensis TaxID=2747483 RepID=A0A8X6Y2S1_9ARAC|nr:tyrosine kinase receptor Cad96Ca [Trichonephila inaurata madagascariensis]
MVNAIQRRRVTTVRTRDDEGDPIEYGIEPAVFLDGSSYFSIDKKTGKVMVERPLTGLVSIAVASVGSQCYRSNFIEWL